MGSLGSASAAKAYPPGIHVPSLTWFKDGDEQAIDWEVQEKHLRFLVDSGLHGIVIAGTNGEAAALTRDEKSELIRLARKIAPPSVPITAGCNGGCTLAVVEDIKAAHAAGADFALVLVPSYFHFAMTKDAIRDFFLEAADKSPVPIVVYNFPGVVSGLDVDSELLSQLGKHPNIVGVKLTCGGIAKVERVAAEFGSFWSTGKGEEFRALAGQSDWLVPALAAGGTGCITGLANLYPKACIKMFDLWVEGKMKEAMELQIELSKCEVGFGVGGINGTKWVTAQMLGYPESSSHCRRPYPKFADEKKKEWVLSKMKLCSHLEK